MLIGVTGATGVVGSLVAKRLLSRGVDQRLVVRDPSKLAPELAGLDVRPAPSYGARAEMRDALAGVDTLFLVPGRESADRVEQHRTAVSAAVEAGVGRIVYLSFVGADESSFTLGREHGETERIVRGAGVDWTFPRMNLYMDFIPSMADAEGVIRGPAGDGRLAAILRDDIAEAVTVLLVGEGHAGRAYSLTGPEAFTLSEAASALGLSFVDETLEEARASRAGFGAPDWQVDAWISSYLAIARGELAAVSDDFSRLTGRPPRSLSEWAAG